MNTYLADLVMAGVQAKLPEMAIICEGLKHELLVHFICSATHTSGVVFAPLDAKLPVAYLIEDVVARIKTRRDQLLSTKPKPPKYIYGYNATITIGDGPPVPPHVITGGQHNYCEQL